MRRRDLITLAGGQPVLPRWTGRADLRCLSVMRPLNLSVARIRRGWRPCELWNEPQPLTIVRWVSMSAASSMERTSRRAVSISVWAGQRVIKREGGS